MKWLWWLMVGIVTVSAWGIYATQHWKTHQQGNLMHLQLFGMWTVTWLRAWAASGARGWRAWSLICAAPPLAAAVGELVQLVWHGGGHTAEWRGLFASLGGVAVGSAVAGLTLWYVRWREDVNKGAHTHEIEDQILPE